MTHDECHARAVEDCARILSKRGIFEIEAGDWYKMVADRMDVIWPDRPKYERGAFAAIGDDDRVEAAQ